MYPELPGGEVADPVVMDFILLTQVVIVVMVMTFMVMVFIVKVVLVILVVVLDIILLIQANHTIYDYGSFGFWGAVLAGGTTMVADGYRFGHQSLFYLKTFLAARSPT